MSKSKIYRIIAVLLLCSPMISAAQQKVSLSSAGFSYKDTSFNKPYIDIQEWRDKPIRHFYVHGGFTGTQTKFSFYFPTKENYKGHFFQYITPIPDSENISQSHTGEEDKISFSISHGAYYVETNGGGGGLYSAGPSNPLIGAYIANAASAQFSRVVAVQLFGQHKVYGYSFGGSGGAYRTIGGFENGDGAWDGAVPYVLGSSIAAPNVFTARVLAMQVLKSKFPQIVDALEPGGNGNMYLGLNPEQKAVLKEVTQLGFPPKAWFAYKTMGLHAFPVLYPGMMMADGQYFKDFWTKPGYLGYNPPAYLLKARIQKSSKIKALLSRSTMGTVNTDAQQRGTADNAWKVVGGKAEGLPVAFQLEDILNDPDFLGGDLMIKTGDAAGKLIFIKEIQGDKVIFETGDPAIIAKVKAGDEVVLDNSNFLAAETYHRHQVPGKEFPEWNQFKDAQGKPLYPQRPMLLGPMFTIGASGVLPSGKYKGKMILLESLWDSEAWPWQADWYRSMVKQNLGDSLDAKFRLWYTDHANHGDSKDPSSPGHLVSYLGVLQQALLDLSDWVEKGISPPASTVYTVNNGQVYVPATAIARKGIQAVVSVNVNGGEKTIVGVGKPVIIKASIELPPNSGKVIEVEWDFDGTGYVPVEESSLKRNGTGTLVTLASPHRFGKAGTYFPTLRVTSQRLGDTNAAFTRIRNLGRVRVVVK